MHLQLAGPSKVKTLAHKVTATGERNNRLADNPHGFASSSVDGRCMRWGPAAIAPSPPSPRQPRMKRASCSRACSPNGPLHARAGQGGAPHRYFLEPGLDWHRSGSVLHEGRQYARHHVGAGREPPYAGGDLRARSGKCGLCSLHPLPPHREIVRCLPRWAVFCQSAQEMPGRLHSRALSFAVSQTCGIICGPGYRAAPR
jgi:hypothetical protein